MLNMGSLLVSSLDYILIVDKEYKIIYSTRYDEDINNKSKEYISKDILGKNFFDVYPKIPKDQCSISKCIETGEVIVNKHQVYYDYLGRQFITNNITLPLLRKGELVAVVELAMDIDDDNTISEVDNERFEDFLSKVKMDARLINFDSILTENAQMKASIEKAKILATLPNPTLIYGETGTGKELFAQAMINYSQINKKKIVIQNCAAVPENLMESILFGTVKGVYTGAENKTGLFDQANGGILFLDELNSIPYNVQSKLLRVLQDGTFRPLGSNQDKHVNVKVIGAMNVDPVEAIESKVLRNDLFYRFSGGLINLLPLRERKEDIDVYIDYYIGYYSHIYNKEISDIDDEVRNIFYDYDWDGNVRELKNTIEAMVVTLKNNHKLSKEMIPSYIMARHQQNTSKKHPEGIFNQDIQICEFANNEYDLSYHDIMDNVERELIAKALQKSGGNRSKAAALLNIPRNTLKYRMEKLKL